jgi:hypothetical protein
MGFSFKNITNPSKWKIDGGDKVIDSVTGKSARDEQAKQIKAAQKKQAAAADAQKSSNYQDVLRARQDISGGNKQAALALGDYYNTATSATQKANDQAGAKLGSGYAQAGQQLGAGYDQADQRLGEGYGQAGQQLGSGYGQAGQQLGSGYDTARGDIAKAPDRLGDLYGGGLAAGFETDPGYQFRLAEGEKAIMQSSAARGGRMGGDTLKALQEHGQGLASQEYNNYAQRQIGLAGAADQNSLGRAYQQAELAQGYGQNAANMSQQYGQQAAGLSQQHGQQASGLAQQRGEGASGLSQQYGQQAAGLAQQYGQNMSNLATGQGQSLGQLWSGQGQQLAGVGMQGAGLNTGLAQSVIGGLAPQPTQSGPSMGQQLLGLGAMAAGTYFGGPAGGLAAKSAVSG